MKTIMRYIILSILIIPVSIITAGQFTDIDPNNYTYSTNPDNYQTIYGTISGVGRSWALAQPYIEFKFKGDGTTIYRIIEEAKENLAIVLSAHSTDHSVVVRYCTNPYGVRLVLSVGLSQD